MKKEKCLSYFTVSNELLDLDLTANELCVMVYMSSIYSGIKNKSNTCVQVKQSTIAKKCGIKTSQTVGRIIKSLMEKGLIISSTRNRKSYLSGIISYTLRLPNNTNGYFLLNRKIFNECMLPSQFKVYLFIAASISTSLGYCWNSYNDIARKLKMKRENVIKIVSELENLRVIKKQLVKSKTNKKAYVDNRYFIVGYKNPSAIRGNGAKSYKRKLRLYLMIKHSLNKHTQVYSVLTHRSITLFNIITTKTGCQEFLPGVDNIFFNPRGSPQNRTSYILPT